MRLVRNTTSTFWAVAAASLCVSLSLVMPDAANAVAADEPKPAAAAPAPATPATPAAAAAAPVSFTKDIAGVLVQKCGACHGASDPKGDYQVTTFELLLKPGGSTSDSITAGKPDESELLRLISSDNKDERMPKDGDPLP
ncbi:MAG TPA: c-type cytochrome domain-containing protein, partial [Pirellulales bacterium]